MVASGLAAFDDQQARFAIRVPHIRVAHQVIGDGAHKWKQTIFGIFELPVGISMGKYLTVNSSGPSFVPRYK
jgi:hypothetical protein